MKASSPKQVSTQWQSSCRQCKKSGNFPRQISFFSDKTHNFILLSLYFELALYSFFDLLFILRAYLTLHFKAFLTKFSLFMLKNYVYFRTIKFSHRNRKNCPYNLRSCEGSSSKSIIHNHNQSILWTAPQAMESLGASAGDMIGELTENRWTKYAVSARLAAVLGFAVAIKS